jgi:hypothetical protein
MEVEHGTAPCDPQGHTLSQSQSPSRSPRGEKSRQHRPLASRAGPTLHWTSKLKQRQKKTISERIPQSQRAIDRGKRRGGRGRLDTAPAGTEARGTPGSGGQHDREPDQRAASATGGHSPRRLPRSAKAETAAGACLRSATRRQQGD